MNFLKYLIYCIVDAITLGFGRSDLVDDSIDGWIGVACAAVLCAVFWITYAIFRKKKRAFLYSGIGVIIFVIVFCLSSILIEYLVTK